ncbi:MAG: hypothetical protein FWH38_10530, partial [Treponema sp.]|nr:hypothetical protein [Treponema sp.]
GYGAGGSALAYLAGEGGFAARHGSVLAVAAIESRLWSSYQPEPPALSGAPAGSNLFRRAWEAAVAGMKNLAPGKVGRTGPLPGQESGPLAAVSGPAVSGPMVPGPTVRRIPVLYVVSGRALSEIQAGWRRGNRPYRAVFDAFRSGAGPAALAAMEGAGPLDYQDFPFTHPVFSFLQPGQKGVKKSGNPVGDTAGIIGNFAVLLLEQARQAEQDWLLERMEEYNSGEDIELPEKKPEVYIPPRAPVSGGLYTESRGFPGFRL